MRFKLENPTTVLTQFDLVSRLNPNQRRSIVLNPKDSVLIEEIYLGSVQRYVSAFGLKLTEVSEDTKSIQPAKEIVEPEVVTPPTVTEEVKLEELSTENVEVATETPVEVITEVNTPNVVKDDRRQGKR